MKFHLTSLSGYKNFKGIESTFRKLHLYNLMQKSVKETILYINETYPGKENEDERISQRVGVATAIETLIEQWVKDTFPGEFKNYKPFAVVEL